MRFCAAQCATDGARVAAQGPRDIINRGGAASTPGLGNSHGGTNFRDDLAVRALCPLPSAAASREQQLHTDAQQGASVHPWPLVHQIKPKNTELVPAPRLVAHELDRGGPASVSATYGIERPPQRSVGSRRREDRQPPHSFGGARVASHDDPGSQEHIRPEKATFGVRQFYGDKAFQGAPRRVTNSIAVLSLLAKLHGTQAATRLTNSLRPPSARGNWCSMCQGPSSCSLQWQ